MEAPFLFLKSGRMPEIVEHSQAVLRNFGRIDSSNLFFKVLYCVIDISKGGEADDPLCDEQCHVHGHDVHHALLLSRSFRSCIFCRITLLKAAQAFLGRGCMTHPLSFYLFKKG